MSPKIVVCSACQGWGKSKNGKCPDCRGRGLWLDVCNMSYYWGRSMKPHPALVRSASDLLKVIIKAALLIFVGLGLILGWDYSSHAKSGLAALFLEQGSVQLSFWISVAGLLEFFVWLRRRGNSHRQINDQDKEFKFIFKGIDAPERLAVDVSHFASPLSLKIVRSAVNLAHKQNQIPQPVHLFKTLLRCPRVGQILLRLEINVPTLEKDLDNLIAALPKHSYKIDFLGPTLRETLLMAFEESLIIGAKSIIPETLFLAIIRDEEFNEIFNNLEVSIQDARSTVLWLLSQPPAGFSFFRRRKRVMVKHRIMNRAWTARPTPMLDRFSYDFTDLAEAGIIGRIVDRKSEIEASLAVLARSTKNNVLLVGEVGSGREMIVKAIARRMVQDDVYPTLRDKRLVVLDAAAMIAGAGSEGQLEERIISILNEIKRAGNIILFIPDIHNLAEAGGSHGFDASEILAPVFAESTFQVIGSTTFNDYHKSIEKRSDFSNTFEVVKVEELSPELSIQILSMEANNIEAREEIMLTYGAIKKAVELSKRYIPDKLLPEKAIDLLAEVAVLVHSRRGKNAVLTDEDVMEAITRKTGIPVKNVTTGEAERLMKLEDEIHERIVDQEPAVKAVSEAIRRVRVGIKKEQKPIGTFLFLGPTGVGKTELAKALAECYFGSEKAMLRFDMSEFQTIASIEKLIGSSVDYNTSGRLTEEVKRHPFALVLFDELEKAHPNVLNIFLQVFDDGRLTDNMGRTVDFSNTIIIATSNAGSKIIQEGLGQGKTIDDIRTEIEAKLLEYFRPEFLNRFTAKIIFKPLAKQDVMAIANLQIKKLSERLNAAQGIALSVSPGAFAKIVDLGYSPTYGARNLERVIQEKVENLVATKFLKGEIKRGSIAAITENDF